MNQADETIYTMDQQITESGRDADMLRAALRKCLPSKPHMNCSAEDFRGDEHISVTMHRRDWEQIAEMALTPDELKEYIKYPRPQYTMTDYDLSGYHYGTPGVNPESGIDGADIDKEIAEKDPCQVCGGKREYRPYTNGKGYRAFSVCVRCGDAIEF